MAGTLGTLNPLRYQGYVYDTETGLYYLQSRYYDPEICRFINADGYASTGQGLLSGNMFAYCGNNPVNNVDPTGESFLDTLKELGKKTLKAGVIVLGAASAATIITAAVAGSIVSGGAGAAAIPAAIVLAVDTLTAAAALSVAIGTTAVAVGEIGENVCYSKGGTKGKSFRAGSKSTRDKWYGHNEQEFHKWYERSGKQFYNNGMDIESKAECDELYEIWKELGCPYPK